MIGRFSGLVGRAGIAGRSSRIFMFQVFGLGFALVSSVLVARVLGPEQKGLLDIYRLLLSITVELGLIGLPAGLLYCAMTAREAMGRVHGTGIVILLVAFLIVSALYFAFAPVLTVLFSSYPQWVFAVVVGVMPAGFYLAIWHNLLLAQDRAVRLQQFLALFAFCHLAAVCVLFWLDRLTFDGVLITTAALTLLTAVIAFLYVRRSDPKLIFDKGTARRSISFGFPIFLGSVANFLHFKVDQLMINAWVGLQGVGLYALSVQWAEMLFLLDSAIVSAALYRIGSSKSDQSRAYSTDIMLIQFVVSLCAAFALAIFVVVGFEFIYGSEYLPSIGPFLLLLPGVVFWSASKPMANYLSYICGKGAVLAWLSGYGLLLNIGLNYLFIKRMDMGIAGASLASSISYFLVALLVVLTVVMQRRTLHVSQQTTDL